MGGTPCAEHVNICISDTNIPKIPMLSAPLIKENIDDKVRFSKSETKYLCKDNLDEYGIYEPYTKLNGIFKENIIGLYDSEKDKVKNIKPLQPKWEHPAWSESFRQKMEKFTK